MNKPSETRPETDSLGLAELLPHRPPMLLLSKVIGVSNESSMAITTIDEDSLFFVPNKGIPSWVGLEFMGQTAALIAGFQQQQGQLAPHTGFLLGSRSYKAEQAWFEPQRSYAIHCQQDALLGDSLASFQCVIHECHDDQLLEVTELAGDPVATAVLTVFRQASPQANTSVTAPGYIQDAATEIKEGNT